MLRKPQIKQMGQTMKILFYNLWSVELKQHHITNNQIIVPATVTNRFLEIAHQQHQGITKTKAMLRTKVWWPAMNDVKNLILSLPYLSNHHICNKQ